jgi:transketolase
MRREFKPILCEEIKKDKNIYLISCDLGYGFLDDIKRDFPDRFIQCKATEQLAMGIGVGLALSGKIPIIYSITPFTIFRPAEWIRNYLDHENIPVKILAAGRDNDYAHDGFSHYAGDDKSFMSNFPNIKCFWPNNSKELSENFSAFLYNKMPSYLNIKR